MRASGDSTILGRVTGWIIAGWTIAMSLVGGVALYDQVIVTGVITAAQAATRDGDLRRVRAWERFCRGSCPVDAQVAGGGARASAAARLVGVAREDGLRDAEALLVAATRTEPINGDAWIQLAYAYVLQDLGPSPRGQEALRRSFATQPFSEKGGMWRIHFAGGYWPLLPTDLRKAAIEEARWRWSIHADERPAVLEALPSSDARGALMARIAASPLRAY